MTPEQILTRLLGDGNLDTVVAAFSGTNPDHPDYRWDATAERRGETIAIEGQIYCREKQVGRFLRQLRYAKGYRQAKHEIMEIDSAHRWRRNGFHHADGDGPVIWPQFGFDLLARDQKARLRKILKERGLLNLPEQPEDIFAPDIVTTKSQGTPIGQESLRRLRKQAGRALPMFIDMEDPEQRKLLVERGLLV